MSITTALKERRFARVFIGHETVYQGGDHLLKLFSNVLVLRCEFEACKFGFLYDLVSPAFDPVPEGQLPTTMRVRTVGNLRQGGFLEFAGEP